MASPSAPPARRALHALLLVAAAVAVAGYFTGTRGMPEIKGYAPPRVAEHGTKVLAPRQKDVEAARYRARFAEEARALTSMAKPPRGLTDPVSPSEDAYRAAVQARALSRAYDGAPPTIPHAVEQQGAPACLACHAKGLSVDGVVAPLMSHAPYTSCQQCHATREGPRFGQRLLETSVSDVNSFVGLASPGHGPRAWPGAPPQIPHRSFMREQCQSCHGVWATGLASSHPHRASCTQCHTPSATRDQVPRSTFEALGSLGDSERSK